MTTIYFKRCGGFIGQGMRLEVDLGQLPGREAGHIINLIDQAEFFRLPENLIIKFHPDEYQYTITVDNGVFSHTVRVNDSTLPDSLRALVNQLTLLRSIAG